MTNNDKLIAIIVIILSTVLVQIHSIEFWTEQSKETGWAFSIALEATMLWLWYAGQWPKVRILAAALLILGPWYQVSIPVFEKIGKNNSISIQAETYQDEIDQLKASLKTYEENSTKRTQWARRIDKTQAKLDEARENMNKALSSMSNQSVSWRLYVVAGMQSAVFLVVMLTQISAVMFCRREVSGIVENPIKKVFEISEEDKELSEAVKEALKKTKTQAELCDILDLNTRDVSNAKNGKPISKKKREEMIEKLKTLEV